MQLLDYLIKYDISNKDFAEHVKLTPGTISHYINQKRIPSPKIAQRIQYVTNNEVTIKDLRGKHGTKELRGKKRKR